MTFVDTQHAVQTRMLRLIKEYLPPANNRLHEAMRYVCLNGGKRLRPLFVYATGDLYGKPWTDLDPLAVAVELIHCYSLVHDDLPAMDDDDLRRGQPTCHRAFDEAIAILAGDALHALAFKILSKAESMPCSAAVQLKILDQLAHAIGPFGMVLGQAQDIEATGQNLNPEQLVALHQAKTGALINASIQCAALTCGEREEKTLSLLHHFGQSIGLAFQIQDDLLDVLGETAVLGKTAGSDLKNQKNTFVTLFGIEEAQQKAQLHYQLALDYLHQLNLPSSTLQQVSHYIVQRAA